MTTKIPQPKLRVLGLARDAKTVKSLKVGVLTATLALAPERTVAMLIDHDREAFVADYGELIASLGWDIDRAVDRLSITNLCAMASKGCARACLYNSGRARFCPSVKPARVRRTIRFVLDTERFVADIKADIAKLERALAKLNYRKHKHNRLMLGVRLNQTSDIRWEKYGIIQSFPDTTFYDYTKWPTRSRSVALGLDNYHLTFSLSERPDSWVNALGWLRAGANVAVVFRNAAEVDTAVDHGWRGFPVIDGDEHDARFLGESGVIVGLKAKGDAKKDQSGFVVDYSTSDMGRLAAK